MSENVAERPGIEAVAGSFAPMDNPQGFLVHDLYFHRPVAAASGNPIIAAVAEMVSDAAR